MEIPSRKKDKGASGENASKVYYIYLYTPCSKMGPDAVRRSLLSCIDRTFKVYISRFAEPGKSKKEADRVDKKRVDDVV